MQCYKKDEIVAIKNAYFFDDEKIFIGTKDMLVENVSVFFDLGALEKGEYHLGSYVFVSDGVYLYEQTTATLFSGKYFSREKEDDGLLYYVKHQDELTFINFNHLDIKHIYPLYGDVEDASYALVHYQQYQQKQALLCGVVLIHEKQYEPMVNAYLNETNEDVIGLCFEESSLALICAYLHRYDLVILLGNNTAALKQMDILSYREVYSIFDVKDVCVKTIKDAFNILYYMGCQDGCCEG